MGNTEKVSNPLEQEMEAMSSELVTKSKERRELMVDITLKAILDDVQSCQNEIVALMSSGKTPSQHTMRNIVVNEVKRAAADRLWCSEYNQNSKSNQNVSVYVGTHWERIEQQQWKDFVSDCAEKCGLPDNMLSNHQFMNPLFEGVAFNLAQSRRRHVSADEVLVNLSNGTLVLKKDGTKKLREHRKEDLFTSTLDYPYDPNAECTLWMKYLDRVLPIKENQQVVAEYAGYCFMRDHRFQKIMWLVGDGQNGKSVLLEILEYLLGSENLSYLSLSDLTTDEVKRAGIVEKLLNISYESGDDIDANVMKLLAGGERVLVKNLYKDPVMTSDYGKFLCAFNQLPRAELTFGFFRRLIIVPFDVTIPANEVDKHLPDKLRGELSGILNWVLKAWVDLMKRGEFTVSESCEMALETYKLQADNVKLFLHEMCEPSEFPISAPEVHKAYRNFCIESLLRPVGRNKFYARLENLVGKAEVTGNQKLFKLKVVGL